MKILIFFTTKKSAIVSSLLLIAAGIQPAVGCSKVNDEFIKLENKWISLCEINSGWGKSGYENYCFLTWKSLQTFRSENKSCISQRNEDDYLKDNGTA